MLGQVHGVRRRAVRLAAVTTVAGLLAACAGVTPMKNYPVPGAEMDPAKPGVFSGDDGSITLYEKK